jgi:hypothetical protein
MRQMTGALFALAFLFIIGCKEQIPQEIVLPTTVPTAVPTVSVPLGFNQRVSKLNPSLQKYVKNLYKNYSENSWKYQKWDKLHQYISTVHKKSEKQYRFKDPITKKEVSELVYGIITYSERWKLDRDWAVSYMTHESGFLDIIGDKVSKRTKKINPPSRWSLGQGQIQIETARGNLRARGYSPKGLTTDDLLYFRLVNMDISICVMSAKIRMLGRKNGTKAYNAGESDWMDGRSDQYYRNVLAIYNHRSRWTEEEPSEQGR